MLQTLLILSASVTAVVEWVKSALLQTSFFTERSGQAQTMILQAFAFGAGIVAALAVNANVLAGVPALAAAPTWVGVVVTGLIASTGSSGIHVVLALLGYRPGVVAAALSAAPKVAAQGTETRQTRDEFAPFL